MTLKFNFSGNFGKKGEFFFLFKRNYMKQTQKQQQGIFVFVHRIPGHCSIKAEKLNKTKWSNFAPFSN